MVCAVGHGTELDVIGDGKRYVNNEDNDCGLGEVW